VTGTDSPDTGPTDEAPSDAEQPWVWTSRRWQVVAGLVVVVMLAMGIGAATRQSTIDDLEDENSALRKQGAALRATTTHVTQERDAPPTEGRRPGSAASRG